MKKFIKNSYLSYKALYGGFGKPQDVILRLTTPFLEVIFFTLFTIYMYGSKNIFLIIVSNSFLLSIYNSIYSLALYSTYEKVFGTLRYILAINYRHVYQWLVQSFMHIVIGALNILISIILISIILGYPLELGEMAILLTIALVAMFSICNFALLMGCMGIYLRDVDLFLNVSGILIMLTSGIFFNTDAYPSIIRIICYCMPLHNSIIAANNYLGNLDFNIMIMHILIELSLGFIYLFIGVGVQKYFEKKSIKNGKLEIY